MGEIDISVIYSKEGVSLETKGLTESQEDDVRAAFDDGEHDPGKLRELIGLS